MGHLNINSLRNKFESIKPIINPNFDIFLASETKLDESFPNNQFSISGYRVFRQDRNCFVSRNKHTIKKMAHCRLMQAPLAKTIPCF